MFDQLIETLLYKYALFMFADALDPFPDTLEGKMVGQPAGAASQRFG